MAWTRHNNLIATGSADGSVKIWYITDSNDKQPFLCFIRDGASGEFRHGLGSEESIPSDLGGHAGVISVDFSVDGTRKCKGLADRMMCHTDIEIYCV